MKKKLLYKMLLIVAIVGMALWFTFPIHKRINLGLDLKGGMHFVLRVDTTNLSEQNKKDAINRALEVIRNRIDEFGVNRLAVKSQL